MGKKRKKEKRCSLGLSGTQKNWMMLTNIDECTSFHSVDRFKSDFFQKHHFRNTQNQCHIKLHHRDHKQMVPNEGPLLTVRGWCIWLRGCGEYWAGEILAKRHSFLRKCWQWCTHNIWCSCGINEMMHAEILALDLAYRRSSINESFNYHSLLADISRILRSSSLPSISITGKKEERTQNLQRPAMNHNSPKLL